MKLLTECAYSGLLRDLDVDVTPIFEALDVWMPDQAAGPIGLALQAMVAGAYREADDILSAVARSRRDGRREAQAMLAMCKLLQKDAGMAEALADDLRGQGGSAEAFAQLMVSRGTEDPEGTDLDPRTRMAAG
jgi:thioredoxin-like negative regulator of GroEL